MEQINFEKISNAVEDILRYHRDIIVSVKEIYNMLINDYNYVGLVESELSNIILNDPRFEYIEMPDYFENFNDTEKNIFSEQRLFIEEMGFYSGPRVKLTSIEIEYEKIIEIISRKVDTMMEILIALWDRRPANDNNSEDQLLEILAKAQKMQREIKSLTENDQITDIIHFLRKTSDFS